MQNFKDAVTYFMEWVDVLEEHCFEIKVLEDTPLGAIALIRNKYGSSYQSVFIYEQYRGTNAFSITYKPALPVLTAPSCDMVPYLIKKGIPHQVLDVAPPQGSVWAIEHETFRGYVEVAAVAAATEQEAIRTLCSQRLARIMRVERISGRRPASAGFEGLIKYRFKA